jgi:purine nucleoside phosphorylase
MYPHLNSNLADTMSDNKATLGIIAGTGFYDLGIFEDKQSIELDTKFGSPSSPYEVGYYKGQGIAFLARHGKAHTIPPHMVNHQANIWGFKELGVQKVIGINSMGSLKLDIKPPCIVIPDDFVCMYDCPTFYDDEVVHTRPFIDEEVRSILLMAAKNAGIEAMNGGAAVQTKGPRFETKAEVRMLAGWGELVGMNMAHEATLCSEAGIAFGNIATVDNYGHGLGGSEPTFEQVKASAAENSARVKAIVKGAIELMF